MALKFRRKLNLNFVEVCVILSVVRIYTVESKEARKERRKRTRGMKYMLRFPGSLGHAGLRNVFISKARRCVVRYAYS